MKSSIEVNDNDGFIEVTS